MTGGLKIAGGALLVATMVMGCGSSNSGPRKPCMVTASGNQVCGQAAAAWCEATDAVRNNSINSGLLPTNEDNTLKQTQSDCQTIEASYGGGSTISTGSPDKTGNSGPTPPSQIRLGQPCTDAAGNSGYGIHMNGGKRGPVVCASADAGSTGNSGSFTFTTPATKGPRLPFYKNDTTLPMWLGGGRVTNKYWGVCGTTHIEEVTNDGCGNLVLLPTFVKLWKQSGSPPKHVTDANGNHYDCALTGHANVWKCNNPSAGIWVEFLARRP